MSPEPEVQVNYSEPASGSSSTVPVKPADGLPEAQEHPLDGAGDANAKVNVNQRSANATAVGTSEILTPRKRERRSQSPSALTLLETSGGVMSPASSSSASQPNCGDATFEPTIEMMVNDFDDEGTLNEEEALAAMECQDPQDEIATLQEESEMPLDELLAKYSSMLPLLPPPRKKTKKSISGAANKRKKSKKQYTSTQQSLQEKCVQSGGNHLDGTSEQTNQQRNNGVDLDAQTDVIVIESGDEENTCVDRKIIDVDEMEVGDDDDIDEAEGVDDDVDNGNANGDEVEKTDSDAVLQYSISNLPSNDVIQKDLENGSPQSGEIVRKRRSHLLDLYPEETFTSVSQSDGKVIPLEILYDEEEEEYEDDEDDDLDDGETDSDYVKKTIMVGSAYQAVIPVGLSQYGDVLPYENEDKLIWEPSQVSEREVEEYLQKARDIKSTLSGDEEQPEASGIKSGTTKERLSGELADTNVENNVTNSKVFLYNNAPASMISSEPELAGVVKDNEQALHLLVQCGYDFKEALRRKRLNAVPMTGSMSIWSEDECHKFEEGIQKFGKDFLKIRQNQVRTRSMRELVQFYYQWKKSERRDNDFANSNTVDHMDIYLNESGDYGPNPSVPPGAPTSAAVPGMRKIPACLQKNFSIMTGGSSGLAAASNTASSTATAQSQNSNAVHSRKRGGGGGVVAGSNNITYNSVVSVSGSHMHSNCNESSQTTCATASSTK